jgi:hypothetical protein
MDNLRIEIRYAVLISLLTLLWLSVEFMVGLQDVYAPYYPIAYWLSLVVIPAVAMRMAINEKEEQLNGHITFKQAFGSGFLIAFFAAVLAIPVQVIFHKLINPDFFDTMISYAVIHAENLKQNAIEAREEAGLYFNLTTSIIQSGLGMLLAGTIIAAISARLVRTDN